MDELLENFVSEEFRVLSYHIVKNKLFESRMQGEEEIDFKEQREQSPSPSPSISQEEELYRPDPNQQVLFCFGMLEQSSFSLYKDLHLQNMMHSFSR